MQKKDPGIAAILGFLFGAFGLFYVSFTQGLIALIVLIGGSACTSGLAAPVIWVGCSVWGWMAARKHNREVESSNSNSPELENSKHSTDDLPVSNSQSSSDTSRNPPGRPDGSLHQQDQYCGHCGAELRDGIQFCTSCGEEVQG